MHCRLHLPAFSTGFLHCLTRPWSWAKIRLSFTPRMRVHPQQEGELP